MTFQDLKKYFESSYKTLPKSVGNEFCFIPDVVKTVSGLIFVIECEIKMHGKKAKEKAVPIAAKEQLNKIYLMIQDEQNHNQDRRKLNRFSNYR